MFQEGALINQTTNSPKKCFQCGLRNFANANECARCQSDLSLSLNPANQKTPGRGNSAELDRSRFSFAWILAAAAAMLLALGFFYVRQGLSGTPDVAGEAPVAQAPGQTEAAQPGQSAVEQDSQSEAAATQMLANLKRFQDATEKGMDYDEYDQKLNGLKSDLNDTLPSFVRHGSSDEI